MDSESSVMDKLEEARSLAEFWRRRAAALRGLLKPADPDVATQVIAGNPFPWEGSDNESSPEPESGAVLCGATVWYRESDGWRVATPSGDNNPWTWEQMNEHYHVTPLVKTKL